MLQLSRLFAFLGGGKPEVKPENRYTYGIDNLNDDVIGDLPDPQGIPLVQTNVIIERMNREIAHIRSELGLKEEEFKKYFLPTCISFIEFADLLPASEYKHHATGGGLIYHSFDVAKRGMRAAQHTQYPNFSGIQSDTQQSRKHWKTATVLACLLHDSGKAITDMVISNGKEGDEQIKWDAHSTTISKWAEEHQLERYFVSWTNNRHKKHLPASLAVMQRLIPAQTWSWLSSAPEGQHIRDSLLGFLHDADGDNPIAKIVAECDADSVRQDMFHNRSQISKQLKRIPISELLSDIMRFNLLERKWSINVKNAKIWYVDDELYITWDAAVPEMIDEVIKGGFSIPEVPSILSRIMIEEGAAQAFSGEEPYHTIYPIVLGDKTKPVPLRCLKLTNPERIVPRLNKVYSIDQHTTGTAAKSTSPVSNANSVPITAPEEHGSQSTGKPVYESSIETIRRILSLMRADQERVRTENELPKAHYPLSESDSACSPAHGEHESEGKVASTKATLETSHTSTSIEKATDRSHLDKIADFIIQNYDFEVVNGVVHIPHERLDEVSINLINLGVGGVDAFTAVTQLKSNEYISIIK